MKNNLSLSSLGLMVCLSTPFTILVNLLDSSPRSSFVSLLLVILSAPSVLCLMLGVIWGVWGSGYNWQSVTEEERAAFLKREQTRANREGKTLLSIVAFLLVLSSTTSALVYGLHLLWKSPTLSLPLFMSAFAIFFMCAAFAAFFWLNVCDRKLRATRVAA